MKTQTWTLAFPLFCALSATLLAGTVGETDRFIPLVQDGGGWSTKFIITNLSEKPGVVSVALMSAKGFTEAWKVTLSISAGRLRAAGADIPLAPGASAVVETSGKPTEMTRGFAEIAELADLPIGVYALLTQRDGDQVVQQIKVPYSPAHERRSVIPVDLTDAANDPELIWVSLTSTAVLDLTLRNLAGEVIFRDQIASDGVAQFSCKVRERWPQFADFRGTIKWSVSFPGADRYEDRVLAGLALLAPQNGPWSVVPGMTLPNDQGVTSPY